MTQQTFFFDRFFDQGILSLHFKAGTPLKIKQGKPGSIVVHRQDHTYSVNEIDDMVSTLFSENDSHPGCKKEITGQYHHVLQHGPYRIVIIFPPLSDATTITVAKPNVFLSLTDYHLQPNVEQLLLQDAKGILIAGAPGGGKSTFAQALVQQLFADHHIIKTLESPRDLVVPDDVVQYSFSHASHDELRDILLLSRPDYTVYDEVRNEEDFRLFKDLRLTGIGLIGVMHATQAIDAVQRFLSVIDLGMIGQVIDTIVYIQAGKVAEILKLALVVKTPKGMNSSDLARPVIEVRSFFDDALQYEIYSYGEQVVVIPVEKIQEQQVSGLTQMARPMIQKYLADKIRGKFAVDIIDNSTVKLTVSRKQKPAVIGKGGAKIMKIEEELGCRVNVVVG